MDFCPRKVNHPTRVVEMKMSHNDLTDILGLESQFGDLFNRSFIYIPGNSIYFNKQINMTAR